MRIELIRRHGFDYQDIFAVILAVVGGMMFGVNDTVAIFAVLSAFFFEAVKIKFPKYIGVPYSPKHEKKGSVKRH